MLEFAIEFISGLVSKMPELQSVLEGHALDIFGYSQEQGWMSEWLYLRWIEILQKRIQPDSNEDVAVCVHVCNLAVQDFPGSKDLWLKRLYLAMLPFDAWSLPLTLEVLEIIRGVFVKAIIPTGGSFEIWKSFIAFCMSRQEPFALDIGKQHILQMMKENSNDNDNDDIKEFFQVIIVPKLDVDTDLLPMFEKIAQAKPSAFLYSMWIDALLEKIKNKKEQQSALDVLSLIQEIRLLFEKCLLLDEGSLENWKKYLSFEMNETGDLVRVSSLQARVKMALGVDLVSLEE